MASAANRSVNFSATGLRPWVDSAQAATAPAISTLRVAGFGAKRFFCTGRGKRMTITTNVHSGKTNVSMENGPFEDVFPMYFLLNMGIFQQSLCPFSRGERFPIFGMPTACHHTTEIWFAELTGDLCWSWMADGKILVKWDQERKAAEKLMGFIGSISLGGGLKYSLCSSRNFGEDFLPILTVADFSDRWRKTTN